MKTPLWGAALILAAISPLLFIAFLMISPSTAILRAATHRVDVKGEEGDGNGTGVMIAPGVMVTAGHVALDGAMTVEGHKATIIRADKDKDIAIVAVDLPCPCVPVATASPRRGEDLVTVGYPMDQGQVLTTGHMESVADGRLRMVLPAAPGNSGGGVFAQEGGQWRLVGIFIEGVCMPMMSCFDHLTRAVSTDVMECFLDAMRCAKVPG